MRPRTAARYTPVQGLSRGLFLLHALNRAPQGWARIAELSAQTGLHRTTVRRLLETLQTEGYVRRSPSDDSYRLNHKIRQLSDGFTDDEWIAEIANPVLGELLKKLVWPSDLCTLDGDCMLVRETTHRFSPLSFHRAMIRQRMPILFTSAGRAWLAFCPEQERQQVLNLIRQGDDAQATLARNDKLVAGIIDKVRAQGYANNDGEWSSQEKISALAVPVFSHEDKVIATVNVVFLRKALGLAEAAQQFVPQLQAAAANIRAAMARNSSPMGNEAQSA